MRCYGLATLRKSRADESLAGSIVPDEDYPLLNKQYATYIIAAGVLAGGFFAYIGIYNASDSATSFLFIVMALFVATGSILIVYRASRLRMND